MEYIPVEGVDYLVDLYAVAEVERTSDDAEIRRALNERTREYHPDRLQGLASEFRIRGEIVAKVLNRAREILLNIEKRVEYDEILTSWEGPVSTNGIPVITISRMREVELNSKSAEEIEATFTANVKQIEGLTGYKPGRLELIERLIEDAGDNIPEDMRDEYEDALLQRDSVLAVEEGIRSEVIGLPNLASRQYAASLEYGTETRTRIEAAKTTKLEEQRRLAIGGVSTRLALLRREETEDDTSVGLTAAAAIGLPDYFEQQAARVEEIAKERESITYKRLKNFELTYPESDSQTEFSENLIIGIETDNGYSWFGMKIETDSNNAEGYSLSDEMKEKLNAGEYKAIIDKSYAIALVKQLEQVSIMDLFSVAVSKYTSKFKLTRSSITS